VVVLSKAWAWRCGATTKADGNRMVGAVAERCGSNRSPRWALPEYTRDFARTSRCAHAAVSLLPVRFIDFLSVPYLLLRGIVLRFVRPSGAA
jgi:hypothetical protein